MSDRAARYPPSPMAMAPAATSARPAVTTTLDELTAADRPAASANGTVNPSAIPMTTSRTLSEAVKCFSIWGTAGMQDPRYHRTLAAPMWSAAVLDRSTYRGLHVGI